MKFLTLAESVEVRPGSRCLGCGHNLTGAAGVVDGANADVPVPASGDFTVCIECGMVMAFDEQLRLRELQRDELKIVSEDDRIQMIKNAVHRLHRAKPVR